MITYLGLTETMKFLKYAVINALFTTQLRHLQNLVAISQKHHLEIYFPFPMEIMSMFEKGSSGINKGTGGPETRSGHRDPLPSGFGRLSDFSANVMQTVVGRLSTVSTYLQGLAEDYGNERMPDPFDLESNQDIRTRSADHTHSKRRGMLFNSDMIIIFNVCLQILKRAQGALKPI